MLLLKRIRIPRSSQGVVFQWIDAFYPLPGIFLRQQAFQWFGRREIGISIIEITVGESQIHNLIQRMDILGGIIPHTFEVVIFEHVEGLQHSRALSPGIKFIDIDTFVRHHDRFLLDDFPGGHIFHGDQTALFLATPHEFLGNIAPIKTVVRSVNGFLSGFSGFQGLLLGVKLVPNNREFMGWARDQNHLLIAGGGDNCCRILPPLNLTLDEAREAIERFERTCEFARSKMAAA